MSDGKSVVMHLTCQGGTVLVRTRLNPLLFSFPSFSVSSDMSLHRTYVHQTCDQANM